MLFNSNVFLLFLAAFIPAYYIVRRNLTWRNVLVVAGSYLFYGWWDFRFLALILVSTMLDYLVGLRLEKEERISFRKCWLALSVTGNLGILGFFKYYNFFVGSLSALARQAGHELDVVTLQIVLPVGISFYTFQTMSYSLDVYRKRIAPTRDLLSFMSFVAFFPQLVAGPIERARHLLPQFQQTRVVTRSMIDAGIWLCLWGLFKKVVIADNLAPMVDMAYAENGVSGLITLLGTIAFAAQIYCDFSGYTDIARGVAGILGFDVTLNFNLPYFATSIRDFWRRWHISLSTWLRDYLYIGLGGNRLGMLRTGMNLMITMLLGGLWHGASWHFVLWGAWHGAALIVYHLFFSERDAGSKWTSLVGRLVTTLIVLYGWLLFRAESVGQAFALTATLTHWEAPVWVLSYVQRLVLLTLPLIAVKIWQYRSRDLMCVMQCRAWVRYVLQGLLLIGIILFWEQESVPFMYFRF
ncbi:MAG: MBOAT family protein [Verrucomicrobia bacterium]|nr:MBOAT family protein [Verrucomicrobiota bacterium]